jgi:hypothetical protein
MLHLPKNGSCNLFYTLVPEWCKQQQQQQQQVSLLTSSVFMVVMKAKVVPENKQ